MDDLFDIVHSTPALEYGSALLKREIHQKLESVFFDHDASSPTNHIFVVNGDPKIIKGVDLSIIEGPIFECENSQTFMNCTPDDFVAVDDELGTWDIPSAARNNSAHRLRAVITSLTYLLINLRTTWDSNRKRGY